MKRSTLNLIISQIKAAIENEDVIKYGSYATLAALNTRMFALKNELDSLKYGDSFYEERKVQSPQPNVRFSRRNELQIVRKERSRTIEKRRFGVFSPPIN